MHERVSQMSTRILNRKPKTIRKYMDNIMDSGAEMKKKKRYRIHFT